MRKFVVAALLCTAAFSVAANGKSERSRSGAANPAIWPGVKNPVAVDPVIEARITDFLRRMSLEQKVGQVIQADLGSVTPEDVYTYHLGSVLNGGNSAPGGKQWAPAAEWLADADRFYDASVRPHGDLHHAWKFVFHWIFNGDDAAMLHIKLAQESVKCR